MTSLIVAYIVKSLWWIIPSLVILGGTGIVEWKNEHQKR